MKNLPELTDLLSKTRGGFLELLCQAVRINSISGNEKQFTLFLQEWAENNGFTTDLFPVSEPDKDSVFLWPPKHLPLDNRPALVITLKGSGKGPTLIFNAHADTVSEGNADNWSIPPFSGTFKDGKVFGLGACDTKGPLVSALWAMYLLKKMHPAGLPGDIFLEIIPGEEDCVGVGTLGSVKRGYTADTTIILEPTESLPRNASRGGLRFAVEAKGKAIHGTVRWLGKDAIVSMRKVLDAIDQLQDEWNDRKADQSFASYPFARPIAVDKISGGKWQGMVCDNCRCEGYLETLPGDNLDEIRKKFTAELTAKLPDENIEVFFTENYIGHFTPEGSFLCRSAEKGFSQSEGASIDRWTGWEAFNSGCESGIRANVFGTPTLVWGPGSVRHAHSPDECIEFDSVQRCAEYFLRTISALQNIPEQKDK